MSKTTNSKNAPVEYSATISTPRAKKFIDKNGEAFGEFADALLYAHESGVFVLFTVDPEDKKTLVIRVSGMDRKDTSDVAYEIVKAVESQDPKHIRDMVWTSKNLNFVSDDPKDNSDLVETQVKTSDNVQAPWPYPTKKSIKLHRKTQKEDAKAKAEADKKAEQDAKKEAKKQAKRPTAVTIEVKPAKRPYGLREGVEVFMLQPNTLIRVEWKNKQGTTWETNELIETAYVMGKAKNPKLKIRLQSIPQVSDFKTREIKAKQIVNVEMTNGLMTAKLLALFNNNQQVND